MFAQPAEQLGRIGGAGEVVQSEGILARRKADERCVAFESTVVFVMVAAEAHNRWAPHLRLFTGSALHPLDQRLCIGTCRVIGQSGDECSHTGFGGLGLVLRHGASRRSSGKATTICRGVGWKYAVEVPDVGQVGNLRATGSLP